MTGHRVRLAGFWTATPTPDGRVAHARRFGRPTAPAGEQVWLVSETPAEVRVNGVSLGTGTAFCIDAVLTARNTAEVVLPAGTELGEVVVEIRPAGEPDRTAQTG